MIINSEAEPIVTHVKMSTRDKATAVLLRGALWLGVPAAIIGGAMYSKPWTPGGGDGPRSVDKTPEGEVKRTTADIPHTYTDKQGKRTQFRKGGITVLPEIGSNPAYGYEENDMLFPGGKKVTFYAKQGEGQRALNAANALAKENGVQQLTMDDGVSFERRIAFTVKIPPRH